MSPLLQIEEPKVKAPDSGRIPRADLILFSVLFIFATCILILHFDFPPLPHNDFVQFAKPAQTWLEFRMPEYYKIMPAFPLAIAGVSILIPDDPSLLHSCEIVVLFSALTFLVFFWLLARRFLPHLWPVLMLLVVINPFFMEFSLQTLMEMFILSSFTFTLWVCSQRTEWSAIPAVWTSLTRYDSVFVIPLVGASQILTGRKKLRILVITVLSCIPFLAWLVLSYLHSPIVNPYVEEIMDPTREFALVPLFRMLVRMLVGETAGGWPPLSAWEITLGAAILALILRGGGAPLEKRPDHRPDPDRFHRKLFRRPRDF